MPKKLPRERLSEQLAFNVTMDEYDAFAQRVGSNCGNRSAVLRSLLRNYLSDDDAVLAFNSINTGRE